MSVKRLALIILSLLILCLVTGGCPKSTNNGGGSGQPSTGYNIGDMAPGFQLTDTSGNMISLSDYSGSPVIINFWYLNCGYCIAEMPYFQQIYDEYQAQGLIILTINITDSTTRITEFMQNNNYTFTVLLDSGRTTANSYNVKGYPTTFFIDNNGIIEDKKLGAFRNKSDIEDKLNKIMP